MWELKQFSFFMAFDFFLSLLVSPLKCFLLSENVMNLKRFLSEFFRNEMLWHRSRNVWWYPPISTYLFKFNLLISVYWIFLWILERFIWLENLKGNFHLLWTTAENSNFLCLCLSLESRDRTKFSALGSEKLKRK